MIVLGCNGFSRGAETFAEHYGAVGIEKHYVLGHDAAATLMVDGKVVAAVEEERLNREKKTSDFPVNAVQWCLDYAGLKFSDIDLIAIPWNFAGFVFDSVLFDMAGTPMPPLEKLGRLTRIGHLFAKVLGHEAVLSDFAERTGYTPDPAKVVFVPHHAAHVMTGYYTSGLKDSAFLISDGRAELFSAMLGEIRDGQIRVFDESSITAHDSMGNLFSAITRYLGFVPNNDEYKVMGLSGYAKAPSPNPFLANGIVKLEDDGRYKLCMQHDLEDPHSFDSVFQEAFGPFEDTLEYKANIAAAAQDMLYTVTSHQLRALGEKSDLNHVLYEGGVALNCLNNTPLLEASRFDDMDVSFGASDTGVTIGAAYFATINHPDNAGKPKKPEPITPYLGPEYDNATIEQTLREQFSDRVEWTKLAEDEVIDQVAKLLTEKVVIGWFEGRIEHGPRALGHRSILANPKFTDIKDVINTRVKHREPFRPFAPLVLEQDASKIFEMGKKTRSPYMTFVFPVKPEYQDVITGAVHVDGTSRVQTVTDEDLPRLAALLRQFTALTDVPCLINTSFNVAGEPIVCTPADALNCFLGTEIDYLVLGDYLVTKLDQPA